MTITINGSGTITGITAGGLPDATIQTEDIVDLAVTPAKMSQKLTSGTAVASTSGTSIDFTSIPSWVKRITVMFDNVSTTSTSPLTLRIGDSGGVSATGYTSGSGGAISSGAGNSVTSTTGFRLGGNYAAAAQWSGSFILTNLSGNSWALNGALISANGLYASAGVKSSPPLTGVLTTVRITTDGGTDTFDIGSINILYEG